MKLCIDTVKLSYELLRSFITLFSSFGALSYVITYSASTVVHPLGEVEPLVLNVALHRNIANYP